MGLGEASALASALTWAVASLLIKFLTTRFNALSLNGWRYFFAFLFILVVLIASGRIHEVSQVSLIPVLLLLGSALIGLGIGETLYVTGLKSINVSIGFPISMGSYPLFTFALAALFLGETVTLTLLAGALIIIWGVYFLSSSSSVESVGGRSQPRESDLKGIFLILLASFFWAIATVILRVALYDIDVLVANLIRLPALTLLLLGLAYRQPGSLGFGEGSLKNFVWVAVAGVLSLGLGGVLFLFALQTSGVAVTTILTSTSPFFLVPFSFLLLKERITAKIVVGIVLCFLGIVVIVRP